MIKLNQNQYMELNKKYDEHYKKYDYQSYELAKDVYLFGAASQQGEIDELQGKLRFSEALRNNQFEHLLEITKQRDAAQKNNRELQKRIDKLEIELKSIKHSSEQCLNAMSISCAEYLRENKKLMRLIDDIKTYLSDAPLKHVSQTAMFKVLDILKGQNNG